MPSTSDHTEPIHTVARATKSWITPSAQYPAYILPTPGNTICNTPAATLDLAMTSV